MTEPTDKIDEQQLEEYLKGDSSVSRQYRQLPGEDVPPSLDRLVLRQAEDAVKRPSRPAWMRWTAPLAVAASAVLVVSIVIETGLRDETIVSVPTTMQAERAAEAKAPVETRMMMEEADVPPPAKVETPSPAASIADAPADAFAQRRSAPAQAAAPAPAQELKRSRQPARDEAAGVVLQEQIAKAEQQKAALESAAREQEQSATQRAMREKPEPKAVLSYSRSVSATADNTATLQRANTDPEAWLKEIRQLRVDNKQEEADREWQRFRETFPNYEVAETDAAREAKK